MRGSRNIRTGIDIGSHSVKLVRGLGDRGLESLTHHGIETWEGGRDVDRAAAALASLMERLELDRRKLGRLATAVDGWDGSCREVVTQALEDEEFARALPYEARRHLNLEGMEHPVIAGQVLGPVVGGQAEEGNRNRVLLAAVPRARREYALSVLERIGLEPELVDLEPLAGLNALFASGIEDDGGKEAIGLLDLGAGAVGFAVGCRSGGLMSRVVGSGLGGLSEPERQTFIAALVDRVAETITYFRGRFHRKVRSVVLSGNGAGLTELVDNLSTALDCGVQVADPLAPFGFVPDTEGEGALYVTACGLCQRGGAANV